jgi:hypothetical protein
LGRLEDLVAGIDVGLGRGDDDVRIGPLSVDDPPAALQPHRDLALRIRPTRNRVDRVELQNGTALDDRLDRLEGRVHRPAAAGGPDLLLAIEGEYQVGTGDLPGLGADAQRDQLDTLVGGVQGRVRDKRLQVFVEDLMFLVGEIFEAGKAALRSSSEPMTTPNSCSRVRNAFRPECLPRTIRLAFQPTSSARMIS